MSNPPLAPILIAVNNDGMGQAVPALSHQLIQTYLNLLDLDDLLPRTICFYAEGVKMAVEGSPVLEELQSLSAKGVELIVCTTCLNHFGLMQQLRVGVAGSMKEIVAAQWQADKVITL